MLLHFLRSPSILANKKIEVNSKSHCYLDKRNKDKSPRVLNSAHPDIQRTGLNNFRTSTKINKCRRNVILTIMIQIS